MSRKLTHEEFMARVMEKNKHVRNGEVEVRGKYVDRTQRIECYCLIHDVEWSPIACTLYEGVGCNMCRVDKISLQKTKTNEEFLKEVYEKNEFVRRGEIEILSEYIDSKTKIKCRCVKHNYIWWVVPTSLLRNIGCKLCGRERTTQQQSKTPEQFVAEVKAIAPDYTVLEDYINAFTPIDFLCPSSHIFATKPMYFLNGERCPYCSNRKVLVGYNDIATTRPDVAALFVNRRDRHKYVAGSKQKVDMTCPLCGKIQNKQIALVTTRGFSCNNCSDFISYPNRFGRAFFDQLPIQDYDTEWQPKWAKPYLYDIHFELDNHHYIVEWDGDFHFEEEDKFGISLAERQERDKIKNDLALQHGIDIIRIDCINSERDYISNNILNSKLNDLFDLSNIDWKLCDEKAQKTLVKIACELYMSGVTSFPEISKTLHIGISSAHSYIKRGAALGWCDYDPQKATQDKNQRQSKPIIAIQIYTNKEYYFNSINACEREMPTLCGISIHRTSIWHALKTGQDCKGFIFKLAESTIQN